MKFALLLSIAMLVVVCLTLTAQTVSTSDVAPGDVVLAELSTPVYPPLARQANIWGDVTVLVTVSPNGTVQSVVVENGHPMVVLRQAATDSASRSRFECHNCKEPMSYRLVYTFKIVQGEDCCDARSMVPSVEYHADSPDTVSPSQSHITVAAKQVCICDPASVLTQRVRSPKCLYLWKCSTR